MNEHKNKNNKTIKRYNIIIKMADPDNIIQKVLEKYELFRIDIVIPTVPKRLQKEYNTLRSDAEKVIFRKLWEKISQEEKIKIEEDMDNKLERSSRSRARRDESRSRSDVKGRGRGVGGGSGKRDVSQRSGNSRSNNSQSSSYLSSDDFSSSSEDSDRD